MHRLKSTLMDRQDLFSAVRGLRLRGGSRGAPSISGDWRHILPQLVELRSLSMIFWKIDSTTVQILLRCTHLQSIRLVYCAWGEDVPQDWAVGGTFGRNLKALFLKGKINIHRYFQIFVPTLTELIATSEVVFQYLKASPTLPFGPSLTRLHILDSNPDRDVFKQFASQCPNIEHLELSGLFEALDVGPDFLPKLQHLRDDAYLSETLVPGRPIRSLTLCPPPDFFARPLPNLEELRLTSLDEQEKASETVSLILVNCPGLVKLSIQCGNEPTMNVVKKWISSRLVSDIAALPRLQVLQIKPITPKYELRSVPSLINYPLSEEMLQERRMMIQIKEEHCPDLYDVWLHPERVWMYVGADHGWIPKSLLQ